MTRCEWADEVRTGTPPNQRVRYKRCPEPSAWIVQRKRYCDPHARTVFTGHISVTDVPRTGALIDVDGERAVVAGWAVDALQAAVERLRGRVAPSARLFSEDEVIEGWDDIDPAERVHLERLADAACDRDDMREARDG